MESPVELSTLYGMFQVFARGRNNPNIYLDIVRSTLSSAVILIQYQQDLRLLGHVYIPDLIQINSAALCNLGENV